MEVERQGQQPQLNHLNTENHPPLTDSNENQTMITEDKGQTNSAVRNAVNNTNMELEKNAQDSKNKANNEDKMEIIGSRNTAVSGKPPRLFVYGSSECDQFYIDGIKFITKRPLEISSHFAILKKTVHSIACGELHTMFLLTNGDLYTSGCNSFHALGRTGDETKPGKVELEFPVDMMSAGELHSVACNSANSIVYQWGTYRNGQRQNISAAKTPCLIGDEEFSGKKIKKILSGLNHSMLLADGKVFVWGNLEDGVIGNHKAARRSKTKGLHVVELNVTGVEDIFAGGNHGFLVQKKKKSTKKKDEEETETVLLAFGNNDFGQLGVKARKKIPTPTEAKEIKDLDIKDIQGGKEHTIILTKDGRVYGLGRNEKGELGNPLEVGEDRRKEYPDTMVFREVGHSRNYSLTSTAVPVKLELSNIQQIFAGPSYNYAIDTEQKVYSWGVGDNFVLGDRKEEIVNKAKLIDNDFLEGKPIRFGLGFQHVVAVTAEEVPAEPKLDEEVFKAYEEAELAEKKKVIFERMPKVEMEEEEEKKEAPVKVRTSSRGKKKDESEVEEESEKEEDEEEEEEEEVKLTKGAANKTKGKPQAAKKETAKKAEKKKPTRSGPKSKGKAKAKEDEDEDEMEEEEESPKKTRGRSQATKKETAKKEEKKKSTRSGSKAKSKAKEEEDDDMEEEEEEEEKPKTRGRSQSQKTNKVVNPKKEEKKENRQSRSKSKSVATKSTGKQQKIVSRSGSKSADKTKGKEKAPAKKKEPEVKASTQRNARKRRTERDEGDDGELKKVKKTITTSKSKSVTAKTRSKSASSKRK